MYNSSLYSMDREKAPWWFIVLLIGVPGILFTCDMLNVSIAFLFLGALISGLRNPGEAPALFWILSIGFFAILLGGELLITYVIVKKRELESQIWNFVGAFLRLMWIALGILLLLPLFFLHDATFWSLSRPVQILMAGMLGSIFLLNVPLLLFHCTLCNTKMRNRFKELDREISTQLKTLS